MSVSKPDIPEFTPPDTTGLYSGNRLQRLFDEMSGSYGFVNFVSSFGFTRRWRRQCVELAEIEPGQSVCDLMTGMGECWDEIRRRQRSEPSGRAAELLAVDFSPVMCAVAQGRLPADSNTNSSAGSGDAYSNVRVLEADVFRMLDRPGDGYRERFDRIVCGFGLKTLAPERYGELAALVRDLLKPGGRFAFVEISVPRLRFLRAPLLFYLRWIIPIIGKLCMGNPDNYRMLGIYTRAFGNARPLLPAFQEAGLPDTHYRELFGGAATAIYGSKAVA